MRVVAVLRPKTRAQKWDPVFGACGKCAILKAPKKRVRNPDPILAPVSRNLALSPVNFLNLKFATKRWKTSLGKFTTSCAV